MGKVQFLEWLRVICALAVIVNHTLITAVSVYGTPNGVLPYMAVHGTIGVVLFAVPVFLMITGYLLLNPQKEISYKKAIGKYAYRIAMVLIIIGTAFAWMEIVFSERTVSLWQLPRAFYEMLQGHSWTHLWYLYALIGIYLFLPVLKAAVDKLNIKEVDVLITILFVFNSLIPYIEDNSNFVFGIKIPIVSVYVLYMLVGYRMSITPPEYLQNRSKWLYVSIILTFILTVLYLSRYLEYMGNETGTHGLTSYSSPLMILWGWCIFTIAKCFPQRFKVFHVTPPNTTFGIYVFHMLWINVAYKVIGLNPFEHGCWIYPLIVIAIFILSHWTTLIYRKIPFIGSFL